MQPESPSRSTSDVRRVLGSSVLRVLTLVSGILVSFFIMPFLVHTLGDRWYGFWALAGSVIGYYGILDIGLTNAAHRFLAMEYGRRDERAMSQVFMTASVLFSLGGLVSLVLTGAVWLALPMFITPAELPLVRVLILLLGVNFAIGFPVAVAHGVLAASLRYDLSCAVQLAKLAVRTLLIVGMLDGTTPIVRLAAITLGVDLAANVAVAIIALRLWPWLRLSFAAYDRSRIREMFGYGGWAFAARLGDMLRFGVDSLVVGATLGVAVVTHYSIAMRLADYFQEALRHSLGVLSPVFSRHVGANEGDVLARRVRQAARLTAAFAGTVGGALIVFGRPFIARWMGPQYTDAYVPLVLLVTATMLTMVQEPLTSYMFAVARHRSYAVLNGLEALANLGLSVVLARRFGMAGVAAGTLVPVLIVRLYFQPRLVCRELHISLPRYWADTGPVLAASLLLQVPIAFLVHAVAPASYLGMIGLAVPLYLLLALVMFVAVFRPEDQASLVRAVPALAPLVVMRARFTAVRLGRELR